MYQLPEKWASICRRRLADDHQTAWRPSRWHCEFDLPSYHYWLHQPAEERMQQLPRWLAPSRPFAQRSTSCSACCVTSGQPEMQHVDNAIISACLESPIRS